MSADKTLIYPGNVYFAHDRRGFACAVYMRIVADNQTGA